MRGSEKCVRDYLQINDLWGECEYRNGQGAWSVGYEKEGKGV